MQYNQYENLLDKNKCKQIIISVELHFTMYILLNQKPGSLFKKERFITSQNLQTGILQSNFNEWEY